MPLARLRALLEQHGYKIKVKVDRFNVKRQHSDVVGVDVMLTDGSTASLAVEQ